MSGAASPHGNYWSAFSLWLGVFGFLVALTAPIPFIPLLSTLTWPFGLAAMAAGWAGERSAKAGGDASSGGRARWGIRLGCLGWIVQAATSVVKLFILAGVLAYGASSLFGQMPTPMP